MHKICKKMEKYDGMRSQKRGQAVLQRPEYRPEMIIIS